MTISVPPKGNSAKELGAYFAPLKVEAQLVVDMTVTIASGSFLDSNGDIVEYVGGVSPLLSAASGGNAKWIAITLTELGVVNVLDGVDGTSPEMPTIPAEELLLAGIFVGDVTTAIYADMVFDLRPLWQTHSDTAADFTNYYTMVQTDNLLNVKADTTGTPETTFTLNSDHSGVPGADIIIEVERGTLNNTSLRWFESSQKWQFNNTGEVVDWSDMGNDVSTLYAKVAGTDQNIVIFGAGDVLEDSTIAITDIATFAQGALADSALQNVVEDTAPQLGAQLDVNTFGLGDGTLELLTFTETPAAINNINLTNAAIGTDPIISAVGDDAAIGINIVTKGGGSLTANGTIISLAGDNLSTFTNDESFTTDAIVATNHYTKTISDDVTGTTGAKINKTAGTINFFAEHDGSGELQTGTSSAATFATAAQGTTADDALQNVVEDTLPQLGGMLDVNTFSIGDGTRVLISFVEDGTAVNNIEIENESAGIGPIVRAVGTDTNIDINIDPKGSGALKSGDTVVSLAGDALTTFDNTASAFTTNATVATNHYTKTESDATTPAPGAKVDTVAGVSGNVVEFGASNIISDSGVATSSLAPTASPVLTGLPQLPVTAKAGLTLGTGLAAEPVGSVTFVNDDLGTTPFILAWVDGTTTWVRSDDGTDIS